MTNIKKKSPLGTRYHLDNTLYKFLWFPVNFDTGLILYKITYCMEFYYSLLNRYQMILSKFKFNKGGIISSIIFNVLLDRNQKIHYQIVLEFLLESIKKYFVIGFKLLLRDQISVFQIVTRLNKKKYYLRRYYNAIFDFKKFSYLKYMKLISLYVFYSIVLKNPMLLIQHFKRMINSLKKREQLKFFMLLRDNLTRFLNYHNKILKCKKVLKGVLLISKGRLNGTDRARVFKTKIGDFSLADFKTKLKYQLFTFITKDGIYGTRLTYFLKNNLKITKKIIKESKKKIIPLKPLMSLEFSKQVEIETKAYLQKHVYI